jgi:hypothetical protein
MCCDAAVYDLGGKYSTYLGGTRFDVALNALRIHRGEVFQGIRG